MCAIAGVLGLGADLDVERERGRVAAMLAAMEHRGPDDIGVHDAVGRVVLGFRRLSIIDVDLGRQPIFDETGRIAVIANGEIYNSPELRAALASGHRFRSKSDCEVLPHLYEEDGVRFLDRLNGMYGFALWSEPERRVLIVRDRLGVKPVYTHRRADRLVFASELKGLFAHPEVPRELDWDHCLKFLGRRWKHPADHRVSSWFCGIDYLPAGRYLDIDVDGGGVAEHAYWSFGPGNGPDLSTATADDCIAGYRDLLRDSARLQLASDVDVGLFLSGGIDSVALAYLAAPTRQLFTYSVATPTTAETGDMPVAAQVAAELGFPHVQGLMEQGAALTVDDWKALVWAVETPMCTAEILYKYRLHQLARQDRPGIKVMWLGQGSDEFNGGYIDFWLDRHTRAGTPRTWESFLASVGHRQVQGLAMRGDPLLTDLCDRYAHPIISRDHLARLAGESYESDLWLHYQDLWRRNLQVFNLWHEDRTAAANSIENRVPFLDHRLVDFVAAVPARLRPELFWDKHILRQAMRDIVPAQFASRPKKGFLFAGIHHQFSPIRDLLQRGDLVDAALAGSPTGRTVFDADALRRSAAELTTIEAADYFCFVINVCLLDGMARAGGDAVPVSRIAAPPSVGGDDVPALVRSWLDAPPG